MRRFTATLLHCTITMVRCMHLHELNIVQCGSKQTFVQWATSNVAFLEGPCQRSYSSDLGRIGDFAGLFRTGFSF
jgi:hypothetical protein